MPENNKHQTVIFYKNNFEVFFIKQSQKVKDKILWAFDLIETLIKSPETDIKQFEVTDGLYEIRVRLGIDLLRIICFFDNGKLIVVSGGLVKNLPKKSRQEIEKALRIKEDYYYEKE